MKGEPWPSKPFAFKCRVRDIPETVVRFINVLPSNCKAVGLRLPQSSIGIMKCERAARIKGIRIMWRGPFGGNYEK